MVLMIKEMQYNCITYIFALHSAQTIVKCGYLNFYQVKRIISDLQTHWVDVYEISHDKNK